MRQDIVLLLLNIVAISSARIMKDATAGKENSTESETNENAIIINNGLSELSNVVDNFNETIQKIVNITTTTSKPLKVDSTTAISKSKDDKIENTTLTTNGTTKATTQVKKISSTTETTPKMAISANTTDIKTKISKPKESTTTTIKPATVGKNTTAKTTTKLKKVSSTTGMPNIDKDEKKKKKMDEDETSSKMTDIANSTMKPVTVSKSKKSGNTTETTKMDNEQGVEDEGIEDEETAINVPGKSSKTPKEYRFCVEPVRGPKAKSNRRRQRRSLSANIRVTFQTMLRTVGQQFATQLINRIIADIARRSGSQDDGDRGIPDQYCFSLVGVTEVVNDENADKQR